MQQIEALKYECDLLVDDYFSEMKNARIPFEFSEAFLQVVQGGAEIETERSKAARDIFIGNCFTEEFLGKHKVEIVPPVEFLGYERTYAYVQLGIGTRLYQIAIPLPANIISKKDKARNMGRVKFSAHSLEKNKANENVRIWELVKSDTYDWKECFDAIERDVNQTECGTAVSPMSHRVSGGANE